ncbi:MAG TPA: serine/threonine-protein kinase, partial [Thermoanaerobaculia bacterium]|nr:serine/threonine-protein kinase [Thermoanaerobaculia bacterium]
MEPDRDARIDQLFEQALDLPEARRGAWLAEQCGGDEALRAEVERLLELAGGEVDGLLGPVRAFASEIVEGSEEGISIGDEIGAYTIVGRLGRGGMGVVWLGERTDDAFDHRVAIKVLAGVRSSSEAVRRFEQERRILARLKHPHIAHLVDGGVDRRGLPYLVLEHVEGEPVDVYCDRHRLPIEQRIRLVVEIATALQAAHRSLVVHRDIKPSNLLVTAEGDVKLLDFGIAKLLDPELEDADLTDLDGRPMTPTYASPEQVNAEPITTASDVYQLGLLLYELVTGRRPQAARTSSLAELVELVCRHEPMPPSRAVVAAEEGDETERSAALRGSTPARLARRFRPDLDAVVARALAKDPEQRYETAAELAADLERFLGGRPVHARRATFGYRASKWLRRNAALAAAGGVAALLTVGYAVAVTIQARAIDRQRVRAEVEAAKAAEVERFVLGLFQSSDPEQSLGREVTARELLERGTEQAERELAGQPEVQARLWSALGEIHGELGEIDEACDLVRRALAQQLALPGDHRREIADSRQRLGMLERSLGNWPAARE